GRAITAVDRREDLDRGSDLRTGGQDALTKLPLTSGPSPRSKAPPVGLAMGNPAPEGGASAMRQGASPLPARGATVFTDLKAVKKAPRSLQHICVAILATSSRRTLCRCYRSQVSRTWRLLCTSLPFPCQPDWL